MPYVHIYSSLLYHLHINMHRQSQILILHNIQKYSHSHYENRSILYTATYLPLAIPMSHFHLILTTVYFYFLKNP